MCVCVYVTRIFFKEKINYLVQFDDDGRTSSFNKNKSIMRKGTGKNITGDS